MSELHQDLEAGDDLSRSFPMSGTAQTEPYPESISDQSLKRQPKFRDSSWPLLSIYSDAAERDDVKMVKRWQTDANGFLIFTGLFSAAVAALLAVTVQDLKPNSQDTSAFYLRNIYQALADPNVTRPSIPSPVAEPPPFSPTRSAVWVNSLWFLSLIMSLSCALMETSVQQWARQYLPLSQQHAQYNPEKRARMRAFFANGVESMYVPQVVEGLPALLHLSLFLFFGGLAIFLSSINHEVFISVIWWIGLFSMAYVFITILPIIRHDSPYISLLSTPVWYLCASILYATFQILAFIFRAAFSVISLYRLRLWSFLAWRRCEVLRRHYRGWMSGGVVRAAEEMASERSSEINFLILNWTISALGDDHTLEDFFLAIPGFLNSKSVNHRKGDFPKELLQKFADSFGGFLGRTWSSDFIDDSWKIRRLDMAMDTMNLIHDSGVSLTIGNILSEHWDEVPQTVEMGQALARWCTSNGQSVTQDAQLLFAGILFTVQERNDSWITLATQVFGPFDPPEHVLSTSGIDSMLLSILIQVIPTIIDSNEFNMRFLGKHLRLDIHNSLPRLQHNFCALWNKYSQEAKRQQGYYSNPRVATTLRWIRPLYDTLHQDTFVAPTASVFTFSPGPLVYDPSPFPICTLPDHSLDAPDPLPTVSGNKPDANSTAPQEAGRTDNVIPPLSPNLTTTSKIGAISNGPDMTPQTNKVHYSSLPTGASSTAVQLVDAAPQDISLTTTLSLPPEASRQHDSDIVAEPGASQNLSTASAHAPTPTLAPITTSLLNMPPESYGAGVDSSHFAPPSIGSSIPASPPTDSSILPHLRARGLVNTGNICFANAVLQLLVNSPPFWDLFKDVGELEKQRGASVPETGGVVTPLVDATVKFFKEFIVEEELPSTQQQSQAATGGTSEADEEKGDNDVAPLNPTYLYDAMKEKRQLEPLLRGRQQDAAEFLWQYLDALDEELATLLDSIGGRQSDVRSQGIMANVVGPTTTRIFGGKFCFPVRRPNKPDLVPTKDWRSLYLDIQPGSIRTSQDILAQISQLQPVQVSASSSGGASQQALIEDLPPVLILHLDRAAASGEMRIGESIQFEPELKIPLEIMAPNVQRPSEPPAHYKLYGVVYHQVESVDGGHYTVNIRYSNGDSDTGDVWRHISDKAVSRMQDVPLFREHVERVAKGRCASLLLYCRPSPKGTS